MFYAMYLDEAKVHDAALGYGYLTVAANLAFFVCMGISTICIAKMDGFDWLPQNHRYFMVTVGLVSILITNFLFAISKYESGPPDWIKILLSSIPGFLPLLLLLSGFILLNEALRVGLPVSVYKLPLAVVSALSVLVCLSGLVFLMIESVRSENKKMEKNISDQNRYMYQSLYQVANDLGCSVSFWQPTISNNQWQYNPADLKKLIQHNTKLIITNFPHNPTGYSPSINNYYEIISIARQQGITIFSDEMYRFLDHPSINNLPALYDVYENGISLWGTAKTFGLAGLRLGWLTSKNKILLKKIESFKDYLSICNNAPSEILATIALNNLDSFVKPNLKKIKSNIDCFTKFHQRNSHFFDFFKPNSGSTAFIKLKIDETALGFADRLAKDTSKMLLPSETFEYGTSHARIGFGRQNLPEVLEILENYIN